MIRGRRSDLQRIQRTFCLHTATSLLTARYETKFEVSFFPYFTGIFYHGIRQLFSPTQHKLVMKFLGSIRDGYFRPKGARIIDARARSNKDLNGSGMKGTPLLYFLRNGNGNIPQTYEDYFNSHDLLGLADHMGAISISPIRCMKNSVQDGQC